MKNGTQPIRRLPLSAEQCVSDDRSERMRDHNVGIVRAHRGADSRVNGVPNTRVAQVLIHVVRRYRDARAAATRHVPVNSAQDGQDPFLVLDFLLNHVPARDLQYLRVSDTELSAYLIEHGFREDTPRFVFRSLHDHFGRLVGGYVADEVIERLPKVWKADVGRGN
jgi:hypothetical protein